MKNPLSTAEHTLRMERGFPYLILTYGNRNRPSALVSPVLSFKNHRRLQHPDGMPGTGRNLHAVASFCRTKQHPLRFLEITVHLLIDNLLQTTAQTNHRFRRVLMPVNRHLRTQRQSIQHPLRRIRRRITQITIHTQSGRSRSLLQQPVQKIIFKNHHSIYFLWLLHISLLIPSGYADQWPQYPATLVDVRLYSSLIYSHVHLFSQSYTQRVPLCSTTQSPQINLHTPKAKILICGNQKVLL